MPVYPTVSRHHGPRPGSAPAGGRKVARPSGTVQSKRVTSAGAGPQLEGTRPAQQRAAVAASNWQGWTTSASASQPSLRHAPAAQAFSLRVDASKSSASSTKQPPRAQRPSSAPSRFKLRSPAAQRLVQEVEEALAAPDISNDDESVEGTAARPSGPLRSATVERLTAAAEKLTFVAEGQAPTKNKPSQEAVTQELPVAHQLALAAHSRLRDRRQQDRAKNSLRDAWFAHYKSMDVYKSLMQIGQANDLAEELDISTRFKPFTREDGCVACHVYEDGNYEKEITLAMFDRRLTALQQRANQRRAMNGQKAAPADVDVHSPQNMSQPGDEEVEDSGLRTAPLKREEQDALQQHIRRVTMETIALAHQMRQQLEAFGGSVRKPGTPFVVH